MPQPHTLQTIIQLIVHHNVHTGRMSTCFQKIYSIKELSDNTDSATVLTALEL